MLLYSAISSRSQRFHLTDTNHITQYNLVAEANQRQLQSVIYRLDATNQIRMCKEPKSIPTKPRVARLLYVFRS